MTFNRKLWNVNKVLCQRSKMHKAGGAFQSIIDQLNVNFIVRGHLVQKLFKLSEPHIKLSIQQDINTKKNTSTSSFTYQLPVQNFHSKPRIVDFPDATIAKPPDPFKGLCFRFER